MSRRKNRVRVSRRKTRPGKIGWAVTIQYADGHSEPITARTRKEAARLAHEHVNNQPNRQATIAKPVAIYRYKAPRRGNPSEAFGKKIFMKAELQQIKNLMGAGHYDLAAAGGALASFERAMKRHRYGEAIRFAQAMRIGASGAAGSAKGIEDTLAGKVKFPDPLKPAEPGELWPRQTGDRVQITNQSSRLYGQHGQVVGFNNGRVTVSMEDGGAHITFYMNDVSKVE